MANIKTKPSRSDRKRSPRNSPQAMLTTAFITNVGGAALPKGVAGVPFRAPRNIVEVISAKPAKVRALLAGYGKAMAESQAVGRAVSFRVKVDPTGGTTVIPMEEPGADADDLAAALDEARARGKVHAATILARDDMLSADKFAMLLGTSRMTVNTKRRNHQVLGLEGAKRGFRFPAWQVGEDGKPFAAIPALFERLGGGSWSVYRFLIQSHPELDGMTGREALRRGKADEALAVADSIADGTFA